MMLKGNFWICLVVLFIIPWSGWAKNDGNMESVSGQLEQLRHNPDNLPALHDVCFYYLKKSDYNKAILYAGKLLTASSSAGNDRYRVYAEMCDFIVTCENKETLENGSISEFESCRTDGSRNKK